MRTKIILLLPFWLMCYGCDEATKISQAAATELRIQAYEQRIRDDMAAWQQELESLRQVTDVTSLKHAEAEIKAQKKQRQNEMAKQPKVPRLSFQEEQKINKQPMASFEALVGEVIKEKGRIATLEGVAAYRENQQVINQTDKAASLFTRISPHNLTDQDKITANEQRYLLDIHDLMDAWRGTSEELGIVKSRLDQLLSLRNKSSFGYSALARYYLNLAVLDRNMNLVNALSAAKRAEQLDGSNGDAAIIKAAVQLQWNDLRSAETEINNARARGNKSFWLHIHEAQLNVLKKQPKLAEKSLQSLLTQELSNAQRARVLTDLSMLKMNAGDFSESRRLHQLSVEAFPDFHWRHGNYGFALLHKAGDVRQSEAEAMAAKNIRQYAGLHRLFADLQMVKWANNQNSNLSKYEDAETLALQPTETQLERMMVRVGHFRHLKTAELLLRAILEQKININTQNARGNTALLVAAGNGYDETIALLVEQGADLELTNQTYNSPLIEAIQNQQTRAAIKLIELGADFKGANRMGLTPLTLAVSKSLYEVVDLLIVKGVDVNLTPKMLGDRQETALTTAVLSGDAKMVETLLAAGADKKVEIMGRSLVEAAQELGHQHVVALLGG
ncbi:MAG: ankyrin repeat domain-containing protein [Pseudomonadales bacterium]|nr:ankyrin repeat domain-containing protein [Pseudomonadales bacterium]